MPGQSTRRRGPGIPSVFVRREGERAEMPKLPRPPGTIPMSR